MGWLAVPIAVVAFLVLLRIGMKMLLFVGREPPPPPPTGELRKIDVRYRCSVCGTEIRVTMAPEQDPEPPRHCMEEMDFVSSKE